MFFAFYFNEMDTDCCQFQCMMGVFFFEIFFLLFLHWDLRFVIHSLVF